MNGVNTKKFMLFIMINYFHIHIFKGVIKCLFLHRGVNWRRGPIESIYMCTYLHTYSQLYVACFS